MADKPTLTVGEFFQLLGYISGALVFIILIGKDMWNAFKKGAHWVPGHALILSALTIQVMNFIENQSTLLNEALQKSANGDMLLNNLFIIHTTRVMLCVMIAFFLPAMARPGYEEKWTKIAAVGLSVFLDVFSELSAVHNRFGGSAGLYFIYSSIFDSWPHFKKVNQVSFFVSGAVITVTLIWLILLLICAAIASKSIKHITSQKIPMILAEPAGTSWKGVEDQVLKSWIVAVACYPESYIARSVLASSAAAGVTICIICSVAGWISHGPIISFSYGVESGLKLATTILEVIFILMGWVVICWRSISSVAYYGRWRKEDEAAMEESWSAYFQIEDFWTRHIVDLKEAENLKLRKLKVDERVSKMFVTKLRKLRVDERLSKMIAKEKNRTSLVSTLLQCLIWVQRFVVLSSKVYWLLSQLTVGNLYIRKMVSKIFSRHFTKVNNEFEDYQAVLKNMDHVLWDQTARDVFLTNRKSIKEATRIMTKGERDGENCHALILFLSERSSSLRCDVGIMCLDPESAQEKAGFKFLWKVRPLKLLEDGEKYFTYASKRSWKLTTVTLINVIVQLSPPCGTNCLQAYYEAWELIDLVDEWDPRTNKLLSKAADRLFTKLREPGPERTAITTMEAAAGSIKELAEKTEKDAENIHGKIVTGKDSMQDWENLAAWNALYTLCKSIDCPLGGDFTELLGELESVLANIIGACINQVANALVENGRKWAADLNNKKLLEAVYIAGKSKGLMQKLDWEPILQLKGDPESQIESTRGESGWSSNVQTTTTAGEIG